MELNLADVLKEFRGLYPEMTLAFLVLVSWRMNAVERSVKDFSKMLIQHLLDMSKVNEPAKRKRK